MNFILNLILELYIGIIGFICGVITALFKANKK